MSVYSISYDLQKPGQDYTKLHEIIKNLGGSWWHYLGSTWLVDTHLSAAQIRERIKPAMDANDIVLIVDIGDDYDGWLPEEAWQWIRTHNHVH